MSRLEPYLRSHCFELAEHRPKRRRVGFVGAFAERLKSAKDTGELPLDFEPEVVERRSSTHTCKGCSGQYCFLTTGFNSNGKLTSSSPVSAFEIILDNSGRSICEAGLFTIPVTGGVRFGLLSRRLLCRDRHQNISGNCDILMLLYIK